MTDEYVTKRQLIVASMIAGIAMALTIGAVVVIALAINDVQSQQIKDNADRATHEAAINRNQAKVIADLRQITNPTPAEYRKQLRRGVRLCLREPSCRKLFPKLEVSTSRAASSSTQARGSPALAPRDAIFHAPPPRPLASTPTKPKAKPKPKPKSRPQQSAPPANSSSPPPAQPSPRPPVDVTVPAPVTICIRPVGGANC